LSIRVDTPLALYLLTPLINLILFIPDLYIRRYAAASIAEPCWQTWDRGTSGLFSDANNRHAFAWTEFLPDRARRQISLCVRGACDRAGKLYGHPDDGVR
jgi:hypothetical protein